MARGSVGSYARLVFSLPPQDYKQILAAWISLRFCAIAIFTLHPLKLLLAPDVSEAEGFHLGVAAGSACIQTSVVTSHLLPCQSTHTLTIANKVYFYYALKLCHDLNRCFAE